MEVCKVKAQWEVEEVEGEVVMVERIKIEIEKDIEPRIVINS